MSGILYKDFLAVKGRRICAAAAGLTLVFLILRLLAGGNPEAEAASDAALLADLFLPMLVGIHSLAAIVLPLSGMLHPIFLSDEKSQAAVYLACTPLPARSYLASKYLFFGITTYAAVSLSILWCEICKIESLTERSGQWIALWESGIPAIAGITLLAEAIELPFYLLSGVRRGKNVRTGILLLLGFLAAVYALFGDLTVWSRLDLGRAALWAEAHPGEMMLLGVGFPAIAVLGFYISYRLTCHLAERRAGAVKRADRGSGRAPGGEALSPAGRTGVQGAVPAEHGRLNGAARAAASRRLLLFLLLAFAFSWIPTIFYLVSGGRYADAEGNVTGAMNFLMTFAMLCPAIAMLLTRALTREGFALTGEGSMLLGLSRKPRGWVWVLLAILLPVLYSELENLVTLLVLPQTFDPDYPAKLGLAPYIGVLPILLILNALIFSFGALGEELGWRGYLMPKLSALYGRGRAILIGGVIWGVWHFPINLAGHNFGHGYPGEPWSGFLLFTVYAVLVGAMLTYVTQRSGSVWPAAFLHAVNNSGAGVLAAFLNGDRLGGGLDAGTWAWLHLLRLLPVAVLGGLCAWRAARESRNP